MTRKLDIHMEIAEVNDETIADVIRLANLDPRDPAMEGQIQHVKNILEQFKVLNDINVDDMVSANPVNPAILRLRADEVGKSLDKEMVLSNASLKMGDYIMAPRILEAED